MSTIAHSRPPVRTAKTVVRCYDILDVGMANMLGDLTDGKYVDERNNIAAYRAAQAAQAEYLLDQITCGPGARILDIGCGYGRILEHAARRGATAVGITVSPPQAENCRRRGLDVLVLNYRAISDEWNGQFDGIIANGSLEHFVQAEDAAAGQGDAIYEELFSICRRIMAPGKRFATTAIHFREQNQMRVDDILKGPSQLPVGSPEYHVANVVQNFGGYYPEPGQLERCARPYFRLVDQEDGTLDYCRTSEYWLRQLKFAFGLSPRVWARLAKKWLAHGRATWEMVRCLAWDQSWMWQFRGDPPPTVLWRHTWEAV